MKKINFTPLLFVLLLISSCKFSKNSNESIINSDEIIKENFNANKKQLEIRLSCGESGISDYIDDGWIVIDEYVEEKICTWKSFPVNKDCDMEKDKGCKITKPDKIGEERIYLLEK